MGNLKSKLLVENRINVMRAEKRVTQAQLADEIGVTRATVVALEKGNYNPSLELAFRLAIYFEIKVTELFKVVGDRDE